MAYREVYNTLTKEAGLDKKALMGPLAFLRKHPQIIKGVYDMPGNSLSKVRQLKDILKLTRGEGAPLTKLFQGLRGAVNDFRMWKPDLAARSAAVNPYRRIRDRFWAALGTAGSELKDEAAQLRGRKNQLRTDAKNIRFYTAPKYGTQDITDTMIAPKLLQVLGGEYKR